MLPPMPTRRMDYGGLLQKDERLLKALCGVGP